jgi:hypothetical protein
LSRAIEKGQWILRMMCALAILLVGFAHQPPTIAETSPFDIAAYALPDGSLPVLCVTDSQGDGSQQDKSKHSHAQDCEACRIGASALLPQPVDDLGRKIELARFAAMRPFATVAQRRIVRPGARPRAPPIA